MLQRRKILVSFFILTLMLSVIISGGTGFSPIPAFAEPALSLVTGTLSHKETVVINGAGFGIKSPAVPRVWDATDDDSANDLDVFYSGDRWPKPCAGTPGDSPYLIDYRTSFHGFSEKPHSRITKFISAAATTCDAAGRGNIRGWDTEWANNLVTIPNWNVNKVFMMFWYRMAPTFSLSTDEMGGPNLKEMSANAPGGYLAGPDSYRGWCGVPEFQYPGDAYERGVAGSCSTDNKIVVSNPMLRWIHVEILWDTAGADAEYYASDGTRITGGISGDERRPINRCCSDEPVSSISIGGFSRWPKQNVTGNYRYWAGIYVDDTYARVMLGNNQTWENSTIREPQIPSAWSTTSITVEVNLGKFPSSGTPYLFVFDADNNHNPIGYPVTIGGDIHGIVDTIAPSAPYTY